MKFNKNICIITGFFLFLINSISAQIRFIETEKIRYDEYIGIVPIDDDLDIYLNNPCYFNCGEDIADFSFNWSNSFNTAVNNEILLKRARDKAKRDWFNKQKNLIKENIESKLGNKFANYNEAKDALFLSSESKNIYRNSKPLINKYGSLRGNGYNISRGYLKELKLLQLRKIEIGAGNINNSKYGYLKANGILLKDIKDINTLNQKWNNIVVPLGSNISKSHYNNSIYQKLNYLGIGFNEEIIALKNNYYNSFDEWEQLNLMQFLLNFEEIKKYSQPPYPYNPLLGKFKDIDKATSPVIEDYAIKNRGSSISIFDQKYIDNIIQDIQRNPGRYVDSRDQYAEIEDAYRRWEYEKEEAIYNLVNDVNVDDLILENGQNELDELTKNIPWKASTGTIANSKYTHFHFDASRGYYKLEDGSIVVNSSSEQALTKAGDLRDKYNSFNPNDRYYYIKLAGSNEWAEMLFNPDNLADGLANLFKLGAIDLGKNLGRYVLPIEDIMVLINGKDFDGQDVSRLKAAGFLLLAIVPGSKALKVVGNVSDALFVAVKIGKSTLVVDTVRTGLKVVTDNNIIKFLSKTGNEIARVVNGIMTFKYTGFGGTIITNTNKTTTLIGKWENQLENIWKTGLAKHGKNTGGLNILGEPFGSNVAEIWANNKKWLDRAISRGDNIRVTANPLDINNVFYDLKDIPTSKFSDINTLKNFLMNLNTKEIGQLGYYGREIRHLFLNGYNFNLITKQFIK